MKFIMQLTIGFYPAVNHNYDGNSVEPTNQQGEKTHTHTKKKTKKQNGHNVLNPFPKKMSREKAAKITDSMVN